MVPPNAPKDKYCTAVSASLSSNPQGNLVKLIELHIFDPSMVEGVTAQVLAIWHSALPDQVRAVAQVLASQPSAMTVADIEARFKSRGAWKKSLPRILETLEALGRARREGDGWRG